MTPKTSSSWICAPAQTFRNRNPQSPERLWIVAAGPDQNRAFAIFPLRRLRNDGTDDVSCVLHRADHEDVGHQPMAVSYEEGRLVAAAVIDHMRDNGLLVVCAALRPHILTRVQRGALQSEFTPGKLIAAVSAALPISN